MMIPQTNQGVYAVPTPLSDLVAALNCEADRAEKEQFPAVAHRQRALALHIENACHQLQMLCPEGYHLDAQLVFSFTPNINPVLRKEFWA